MDLKLISIVALFSVLVFSLPVLAETSSVTKGYFTVDWDCTDSISKHECLIEITNNDLSLKHDFDLEVLIDNTSYSGDTKAELYEWKNISHTLINQNCTLNQTTLPNSTVVNNTYCNPFSYESWFDDWKPTKSFIFTQSNKQQLGTSINIGKGETKLFRLIYETPIGLTSQGWGSFGKVAIVNTEGSNSDEYHPWFNSTFERRQNITVNNTLGVDIEPYVAPINITYDSDMVADFSDLRFTWYNDTSGAEQEIDVWNDTRVNSNWILVHAELPENDTYETVYVYYMNTTPINATWNGTNTCYFYDDFEDSNYTSVWTSVSGSWSETGGAMDGTGNELGIRTDALMPTDLRVIDYAENDGNGEVKILTAVNVTGGTFFSRNAFKSGGVDMYWYNGGWNLINSSASPTFTSGDGMTRLEWTEHDDERNMYKEFTHALYGDNVNYADIGFYGYAGGNQLHYEVCIYNWTGVDPTYTFGSEESLAIPINVTMTSPTNTSYNQTWAWINATTNVTASLCLAQVNGTNNTMTNSTGNWNYNFSGTNATSYNAMVFCNSSTNTWGTSSDVNFTLQYTFDSSTATGTGNPDMSGLAIVLIGIAGIFAWLSQSLDKKKHAGLRLFFFLLMFIVIYLAIWIGYFWAGYQEWPLIQSSLSTLAVVLGFSFAFILLVLLLQMVKGYLEKVDQNELEELNT